MCDPLWRTAFSCENSMVTSLVFGSGSEVCERDWNAWLVLQICRFCIHEFSRLENIEYGHSEHGEYVHIIPHIQQCTFMISITFTLYLIRDLRSTGGFTQPIHKYCTILYNGLKHLQFFFLCVTPWVVQCPGANSWSYPRITAVKQFEAGSLSCVTHFNLVSNASSFNNIGI